MSDFLGEVTAHTRKRIEAAKTQVPLSALKNKAAKHQPQSFKKALERPGSLAIIAELKQASPSAGVIRKLDGITSQITAYISGGAAALSILTEEEYFHGSPQLLEKARLLTQLPLLRKDFIVDTYQIHESRAFGADAVLLITSLLPGAQLAEFIAECDACGLDALVEVHSPQDLDHALASKARIIGINNRNLHTLKVDTSTAPKLLPKAANRGVTLVVESGIKNPSELRALHDLGAHAVLIGEALMRSEHPEYLVKEFVKACQK